MEHPTIEEIEKIATEVLEDRYSALDGWPKGPADALYGDPRCGCEDECWWNDVRVIESELERRD